METINTSDKNAINKDLILGWYGRPIALMKFDGANYGFDYNSGWMLPMESYSRIPGKLPMYLRNLLPPDVASRSVDIEFTPSVANYFLRQERFMSNLTVGDNHLQISSVKPDYLHGRLAAYTDKDCIFTGDQDGIVLMTRDMSTRMTDLSADRKLTHISGSQVKIPVFLNNDGVIQLATNMPSTHIIKYSGFAGDTNCVRGAAEWIGMTLATAGGVNCAEFALVEMDSERGKALNYLTERFDLPIDQEDPRMLFCEELGAAMNLHPGISDLVMLNDVIDSLKSMTTNEKADMKELFRQVVANCILENGDFHSRNMSLLKVAEPTLDGFRSVRLSPAYDIMRTREFSHRPLPPHQREGMRLELAINNNEDYIDFSEPDRQQFQIVGSFMGMNAAQSDALLLEVALGMAKKATMLRNDMPRILDKYEIVYKHVLEVCDVVIKNAIELIPEIKNTLDNLIQENSGQSRRSRNKP